MKLSLRIYLLPLLLVFQVFMLSQPEAFAAEKMWIINQKSKLLGDMVLVISKTQMKVYRLGLGCSILAKANDPKITVLNKHTKVYAQLSIKQYASQEDSRLAMLQGYLESLPMVKVSNQKNLTICSLATRHYKSKSGFKSKKKGRGTVDNVIDVGNLKVKNANLWTTNAIPLNPAFQTVIHSIYKLPKVAGVPLLMKTVEESGKESIQLVTRKAVQKPYNSALFKIPKNLKPVDDYAQVMHSSSNLNSLINYFDIMHNSRHKN